MRIFITGGTGFIGTHLVKELVSEDNNLLLLSRRPEKALSSLAIPGVDVLPGDLSDIEKWENEVKRFNPQTAIHLAWESLPDYNARTSVRNLIYGLNLVTMLAESGCESVLCTGSCWEYGQQSGKLSEDVSPRPLNAFSAAKNSLHWLGKQIAREHDMHFAWARLFYAYGPGQRETSLIPHIISCVREGREPEIKTPLAKNDFVYVGDVARAISAMAKKPQIDGVYNIGSGRATSVQEVVKIVCDKLNFPDKYGLPGNPIGDSAVDFWADISKIKYDTGWEPQIGIKEGIQKTIDYYLDSSSRPASEF